MTLAPPCPLSADTLASLAALRRRSTLVARRERGGEGDPLGGAPTDLESLAFAWLDRSPAPRVGAGSSVYGSTPGTRLIAALIEADDPSCLRPFTVPNLGAWERDTAGRRERDFSLFLHALAIGSAGPVPKFPGSQIEIDADAWAERAAVLEYDGGLPRGAAEQAALSLLLLGQMDDTSAAPGNLDRVLRELDRRQVGG